MSCLWAFQADSCELSDTVILKVMHQDNHLHVVVDGVVVVVVGSDKTRVQSSECIVGLAVYHANAEQAESMEAADATIDRLASEGRLDPALLLTMAKAYSAAKETDKTKDEVKDIMAHLYFKVGV